MPFDNLPTLAEMDAQRSGKPIPKGKSRLEESRDDKKLTVVTERDFKHDVWTRDDGHCRCCGRKVIKTLARVDERGEVHHIHGRTGDLRFEARAAVLVCCKCHERLTGRVNDRLGIMASKTFTTTQGTFMDARSTLRFRKVA